MIKIVSYFQYMIKFNIVDGFHISIISYKNQILIFKGRVSKLPIASYVVVINSKDVNGIKEQKYFLFR
uniref:Uncharacterized protein n=1 Tax=Lepeophtheirus salmonis TaxID=72036 RepID=A0A0K2TB31_LEPSM